MDRRLKVTKTNRKRRYKRGYPVAVLVGFESDHAAIWRIFSRVAKPTSKLELAGRRTDEKTLYNFHESVIDTLKPILREGVKTVVIAAPARTAYTTNFMEHIQKHHRYLIQSKNPNRANFAEIVGSADSPTQVAELVKTPQFTKIVAETTSEEADHIVGALEKQLYDTRDRAIALYSLKEIEDIIYDKNRKADFENSYLLLTNQYLAASRSKSRIHRLMQISQNKKVKTKIVNAETAAGARISQFGGIIFFSRLLK
jgi:stalled ribosome rescue protein Dom34